MVQTGLVETVDLGEQRKRFLEVGRLAEALQRRFLSALQPWIELLDAGPVLSPVLDILGEVVALRLDLLLEVRDILGDPVELILVCLGILWNLFTWERR